MIRVTAETKYGITVIEDDGTERFYQKTPPGDWWRPEPDEEEEDE